jgi:hypothetical protein
MVRGGHDALVLPAEMASVKPVPKGHFCDYIMPSDQLLGRRREKAMSKFAAFLIIAFALLSSRAFAQTPDSGGVGAQPTSPGIGGSPPPPPLGSVADTPPGIVLPGGNPLISRTDTGLNEVGSDGISTKTVPAKPCTTYARETDGTTTCVGIPGRTEGRSSAVRHRRHRS